MSKAVNIFGIKAYVPSIRENEDIKDVMKLDIIRFSFRMLDADRVLSRDMINYLNECTGVGYSAMEYDRIRNEDLADGLSCPSRLIIPLLVLDRQAKVLQSTDAYIKAICFVCLGFIQCIEGVTFTEMASYYRISDFCIRLRERVLGDKLDFDPIGQLNESQRELVRVVVKADRLIHGDDEKDIEAAAHEIEESIGRLNNTSSDTVKDDSDTSAGTRGHHNSSTQVREASLEKSMTAQDELDRLVGLVDVKEQVKTVLNVHRATRRCEELGIKRASISLHMVFTGNPVTGKTTVARLLSRIYKENGVLSKGHLVEVSRADIVGKYVGHTAALVKEAFHKAKGGILFVDEAYMLTRETGGYGQEALETLLKLMEDERDDILVIVAGYPELMQEFMDANPGIRSRFPFTVHFDDYTGAELFRIFRRMCLDNSIRIGSDVAAEVRGYCREKIAENKYKNGNAREVRNLFEKMLMKQANRLDKTGDLSRAGLCRFVYEDLPWVKDNSDDDREIVPFHCSESFKEDM